MGETLGMGILGCGDYLRWQKDAILASARVRVEALYDPDATRAQRYARELGGAVVASADAVFDDPDVQIVCLFVPPWVRKGLALRAARAGKHIVTTKPLAASVADCAAIVKAVEGTVACGVQYNRTGNAVVEAYKSAFDGGEVGRLALYKQDWIHHYPQWNRWATDPEKNGGPFMDAMIHNLNTARYLMGRPATHVTFFSDNHAHPGLKCADTECMKLDFEDGGSAHLFITWAADLAVYSTAGNDREHIDIRYMVTDQGWRLTEGAQDGRTVITASREGGSRTFQPQETGATAYDAFAVAAESGGPLRRDIVSVREAYEDVKLLRDAERSAGVRAPVDLSLT